MQNRWDAGPPQDADDLDRIVYLSNLIGLEESLVQPGGGNTSIKVSVETGGKDVHLLVKGSGTDLRTIGRQGFTRLAMGQLAGLRDVPDMSDEEMMRFLARCMVEPDQPAPSVETPLHALLPQRVIAHTHDVGTMSLTNIEDDRARELVAQLFEGRIHYVPYARPGFPLAALVAREAPAIPGHAEGLVLAHHGLVVWADDVAECYARLHRVVERMEDHLAAAVKGHRPLGGAAATPLPPARRRELAALILPAIRGALGAEERVVLHFDDDDEVLRRLGSERFGELSQRGMTTPEHILRAGRLPLWLPLDLAAPAQGLLAAAREGVARGREEYLAYHGRCAAGQSPLADWTKVVLVPGLGMVTAFKDKRSAETANACYRAVMASIENAEAVGGFRFLPEEAVFEFEHWPLERRKVEEEIRREREALLLPRRVVVVLGGGSGIGRASALRFAAEGAHVVVADLDAGLAQQVAAEIDGRRRRSAIGLAADVTEEATLEDLFRETVLAFGGLDCLCYAAGVAPRFAEITEIAREDLARQLEVHYLGAVLAIREAARVMIRQGLGGSIVASVSKAALAPGKEAVAYGGSKAALLQALRVAAVELGPHGIRVNAINADQVETPLFLRFVAERAARKGITVEEQLQAYRERNVMGASLIPADAVGDLAVLLASDRFRYTTGDILTIDGGLPEAFPR